MGIARKIYKGCTFVCKKVMPHAMVKGILKWHNYPELRNWTFERGKIKLQIQRYWCFFKQELKGIENIPVFVVSYNRLSYVKMMVEYLVRTGKKNVIIIDNASTYPPLLEYYKTIPYKVIRLDKNYGHMVFWNCPLFEKYRRNFYILTDPDVIPVEECPQDYIKEFFRILKRYPFANKVGFSLKLDDLPDDAVLAKAAIEWEKQLYWKKIVDENLYDSMIDTTFALYVPDRFKMTDDFYRAIRTMYPYEARHLPWYKREDEVTEEDLFYANSKITGQWNIAQNTKE